MCNSHYPIGPSLRVAGWKPKRQGKARERGHLHTEPARQLRRGIEPRLTHSEKNLKLDKRQKETSSKGDSNERLHLIAQIDKIDEEVTKIKQQRQQKEPAAGE